MQEGSTCRLPPLKVSAFPGVNFYYEGKAAGGGGKGRNRSSCPFGDERAYDYKTQTMVDYHDYCPERYFEPEASTAEVRKWYNDAQKRVGDWRVDEMEAFTLTLTLILTLTLPSPLPCPRPKPNPNPNPNPNLNERTLCELKFVNVSEEVLIL